jgi:hypothetical protein
MSIIALLPLTVIYDMMNSYLCPVWSDKCDWSCLRSLNAEQSRKLPGPVRAGSAELTLPPVLASSGPQQGRTKGHG